MVVKVRGFGKLEGYWFDERNNEVTVPLVAVRLP
jgi:hypothetical protein